MNWPSQGSAEQVTGQQGFGPAAQTAGPFLSACLRAQWDPAALDEPAGVPDNLVETARAGGVGPLLYSALRGRKLVPPAVEEELRRDYYGSAARAMVLWHELEKVLRALAAEQIPVILLKGAALAEAVYVNSALRPMGDLDLLVREKDVPAALRALAAQGYSAATAEAHAGLTVESENEVALCGARAVVEIHWSLLDSPYYQSHLPIEWFWQTAQPLRVGAQPALALGPEAQLLHLCAHLLLHHGGESPRLLWLHDIAAVLHRYGEQIDWPVLLQQAQACDLVLPLQQLLPRVAREWARPIPETALPRLAALRPSRAEARVFGLLTAPRRPVIQRFWTNLRTTPTWPRRLRYALQSIFPSPSYMQRRYSIRHRLLVPFYYPYRWYVGVREVLKQ